jgi:hypothetical protein
LEDDKGRLLNFSADLTVLNDALRSQLIVGSVATCVYLKYARMTWHAIREDVGHFTSRKFPNPK